ncbi:hypothetical protein [Reichenbachiella versicolor]|uniref:hypothetical protein n=1 Tax=Reichenbachiella versicolor TaxID=1821036 RepID=UPI000D6E7CB9|nr:hypothetical protein [Reichenbachiella versicolor]
MQLHITEVPAWVSISFVLFFAFIPTGLISRAVKRSLEGNNQFDGQKISFNIKIFYTVYLVIVGIASIFGLFSVNTLPPRIIIFSAIPLMIFYLLYIRKRDWFKAVYENITLDQLIFIQVFRFVGVYFFLVNQHGAIPDLFAQLGGYGDILTAALVFPTVYLLKKNSSMAKSMAWIWNIIGLVDILLVMGSANLITAQAIQSGEEGVAQFGTFPFSWIPAFAPMTIIFLHILTFKKLIKG